MQQGSDFATPDEGLKRGNFQEVQKPALDWYPGKRNSSQVSWHWQLSGLPDGKIGAGEGKEGEQEKKKWNSYCIVPYHFDGAGLHLSELRCQKAGKNDLVSFLLALETQRKKIRETKYLAFCPEGSIKWLYYL